MFSNLTHNAMNALMLVAQHQVRGPVTTEFISRQLGLSISYLESLMSSLKKKGFVISYRGPGGGYCTFGKPNELKVLDVINAFEDKPCDKSDTDEKGELNKNLIADLVENFLCDYLRDVYLSDVLSQVPEERWMSEKTTNIKAEPKPKFKPLKIHKLPSGPNSVFNLAQSMAL